jgi:hypothetical protein
MVSKQGVGFKHFKNSNPDDLMQYMQDWINGGTNDVSWVAEFHIIRKGSSWHAFVKYVKETED